MARMIKVLTATLILVLTSLVPAAAGPSSRKATASYGGQPSTIMMEIGDSGASIYTMHSDKVLTEAGEKFVSVEITDDSGEPVAGRVHQGGADLGVACGDGVEQLALVNRKPIHVHLQMGLSVECDSGSSPSGGTITLTFHR